MLWKFSAALATLYIIHGSENVARDSARLAQEVRHEAPAAAVSMCLDKPILCQHLIKQATGLGGENQAAPAPHGVPKPNADPKAAPLALAAGEFPVPPVRPATLNGRKGS
ncbi:MAG: hypothetical protein FD175_2515 [Beijerinckiaceae bacterium]|nr:MAG: hypothetical protein FD175_2515 [Beijerinckiaceae bacterium]